MITEEEPCLLDVEIQSLKAIFAEELQVNRADENGSAVESLVLQMTPESSKGENVQFVRFEIILEIPSEYPQAIPKITLKNVRGLSEEAQTRTKEDMLKRAAELSGTAMLFELIQVAKEQFTSEDTPSIPCSICLFSFDSEDSFSRTPCFHFFHTHCLANHVQYTLAQKDSSQDKGSLNEAPKEEDTQDVLCPVCRLPIPFKESDPEKYPVPRESLKDTVDAVLTPELRKMQEEMAELYSQQLAKGGIINLEAEKNKFFIEISNTPDLPVLSSAAVSPSSAKQHQSATSATDVQNSENASDNARKHHSSDSRKYQGRSAGRAQSSDRPYAKGQYRKPGWSTENSDKKPVEEEVNNWEPTEPNESNQNTDSPRKVAPYKKYSKREGQTQRQNNKPHEERYRKLGEDENDVVDNQENRREKYDWSQEKKSRRRNQFYDKRGSSNENYNSQSKEVQDTGESKPEEGNESELNTQENSNARPPYRGNMKKKFRRPRNNDPYNDNQDLGTGIQTSEGACNNDVPEGVDSIKLQESNTDSNKNNSRNSTNDSQARNYKSNYNRYDNRSHTKRFYKDKQLQSDGRSESVENQQKNDGEDQTAKENDVENQVPDGEQFDDRFQRNNFRYRNNAYGKNRSRGRNFRKENNGHQYQDIDNNNRNSNFDDSQKQVEKLDDTKCDPQEMSSKDSQYSEQDSSNIQPGESNYRPRNHENRDRRYDNPKPNRRYQRNYQNISETDSYSREDTNEHSVISQRPRYWNRHDNFGKQGNYAQLNSYRLDSGLQEPSENDSGRKYDSDIQSGKGNFRNRGNGRQRYGNSRSDYVKGQQLNEPEVVQSDCTVLDQSSSNDQSSENREDFVGRKSSNYRTNRRDMNWKGRNSHQRYSFPQASVNLKSQSNTQVAASASRTDPSTLRPNIKPFTLMCNNSTTQDAQTLVSIPPPF